MGRSQQSFEGSGGMNNIILVSQGISFMVNAIVKNIEENGFKVVRLDPSVDGLEKVKDESSTIVVYLSDAILDAAEFLVFLKDICIEEDKFLVILGNANEVEKLEEHLPNRIISSVFERPIDMKKFVERLQNYTQATEEHHHRQHLLLVDDDPTFLKMMKEWLSDLYNVTIVTSGAQAMMFVAEHHPDLILLDYEMPVTSGPQVLEMLRSETSTGTIPVFFLTGKDDRESVMKVLSLNPEGYLLKSSTRERIRTAIADFFAKQHMERAEDKQA